MKKGFASLGAMLIFFVAIGLTSLTVYGQEQPSPAPPFSPHQTGGAPPPSLPPTSSGPPPVIAPPAAAGGPSSAPPALLYVGPGVFEIGRCRITKAEGKVEFPAAVNMKEGLLEYLVVGDSGKLHESLLRTDVEPYALQVALLLAGLEGSLTPLSFQGEDKLPTGDAIDIWVAWQEKGKEHKVRIEELLLQGKDPVGQVPWVFTGSLVSDGVFVAQAEKSIIAVFHDPTAMIDHRLPSGANDEVWFVNSQATPAVGTPLTVTITKKQGETTR